VPDARPLRPAAGHGPIFIIGAMGSGTTLLRLMLDSHERIAIPPETGFMRAYNAHQFIPFKWSGRNWAKRLGWTRAELDRELAQFYERLFMRYVERHGKQRWGEKTPLHTFHIDDMARLFPDSVFVGIVRHPGGEVASTMSRFGHTLNRATYHYLRYTKELVRQAARYPDRFVVLRYEDLVLQPERALGELLDWLGEPWSDQVLAHHTVQSGRGGRLKVEGGNRVDEPIDTSRIAKWTHTLDPMARRRVARRLGGLGGFLGYSMDDAAALEPLRADGSLLAGGADVDARIDDFPGLDLRTQMSVPYAARFYHPRDLHLRPAEAAPAAAPGPTRLRRAAAPVVRRLPTGVRWWARTAMGRISAARPARRERPAGG
jgi:Sulfotransferase family